MRIREHRKRLGLTVQQLADMVGVSKGYISEMETGKKTPGSRMVMFLAEALRVRVSDLYDGDRDDAARAELEAHLDVMRRLSPDRRQAIEAAALAFLSQQTESS